jgi:hypothetical protein
MKCRAGDDSPSDAVRFNRYHGRSMNVKAQDFDPRTLALYDFLLLTLVLVSLADLRMFAHGRVETVALAAIALGAIVGSAIAEWKLLGGDIGDSL